MFSARLFFAIASAMILSVPFTSAAQSGSSTITASQINRLNIIRENESRPNTLNLDFRQRVEPPKDYEEATGRKTPGESNAITRCQTAARAYIDYMAVHEDTDPATMSQLPVTRDLRAVCLASASDTTVFKRLGTIADRIGTLTFDSEPQCTGFILASDRIVTARHCLWMRDGTVHPAITQRGGTLASMKFVQASTGAAYIVVPEDCNETDPAKCGALPRSEPFAFSQDIVRLKLIGGPQLAAAQIGFTSNVAPGDALVLVGASASLSGRNRNPYQPEVFAMAPNVGCVVGYVSELCLYHGCLALPSFSGAALVRVGQEKDPQVVGIHLEGTGADENCSGTPVRRSGNVALRYGYGDFKQ